MIKKLSIGFGMMILTIIVMFFSIQNVKAYDFTGYKEFTQIYLYKESANYEDKTCNFTGSDPYCSLLLRYNSFPYDRLTYKLYANNFNLQKGKEYRFTFFLYSTFDISTFVNDFVFRVGKDDYTFTIVEPTNVALEVELVGANAYATKVSLNFISPYDNGQVLSLFLNDTSKVLVDSYFGAYRYYDLKEYEVEKTLPYIDLNYSQVKDRFNTYFPEIDKIINYLNTNYNDDYDYVMRAGIMSDTGRIYILASPKGNARTYLTGVSNDDGTFNRIYLGKLGSSENDYKYCAIYANDYNEAKTTIDECFLKNYSHSGSDYSFYTRYNQVNSNYILDYVQSTTSTMLLYSNNKIYNRPVHDGVEVPHEYNFYLDGKLYELNDEIPTFWEWYNSKGFFTFKELDFNPNKTNEIIFDYKIPTGKTTIDFDLDYSIKSDIDTSPNLPIPILKVTYESGIEDTIYLNPEGEDSNSYIGHYIGCLGSGEIITNLQLIIDLKGVAGLVDIEFASNFDFDATYTNKVLPTFTHTLTKDETYNYMKVDFTFHNWTDKNYKWVISSTETYQHDRIIASINSDMKNYTLYANTTETMYVSLYYKDNPLYTEIIEFPDIVEDYFTKEEIESIQKEETFRKEDYENMKDIMNSNKDFIQQLAPITEFFKEIFEHMFKTLPSQARHLLIFMFSISLLVGIAWWLK